MPTLLLFVIFFVVFLYIDISIHASPNNNVWLYSFRNFERNQHVYILLCLASFTQCCFHNSSKLCEAVVHSLSLLYSILWICHNFSIVDGILGSLWTIMKNSSMNLLSHVLWCTCTWFFPTTHTQEWNDQITEFNYLHLYWLIPNCFLKYCFNL